VEIKATLAGAKLRIATTVRAGERRAFRSPSATL